MTAYIDKINNTIELRNKDKQLELYKILFSYESQNNIKYLIFSDDANEQLLDLNLYVCKCEVIIDYEKDKSIYNIEQINSEEWNDIEVMLSNFQKTSTELLDKNCSSMTQNTRTNINNIYGNISNTKIKTTLSDEKLKEYYKKIEIALLEEQDYKKIKKLFSLLILIEKIKPNINYELDASFSKSITPLFQQLGRKSLGLKAYQKKNYYLAELAFTHTNRNDNLAYIVRRGEVKNKNKYSPQDIFNYLKSGVEIIDSFSMVNMSLFLALNINNINSWIYADRIMSMIENNEDLYEISKWWLNVANNGETEGFLVHYWLLRHNIINKSPLGDCQYLINYIEKSISLPDFMKQRQS